MTSEECEKQFGNKDTDVSRKKRGKFYKTANDTKIFNKGERTVKGYTQEGRTV